MNLIAKIVNNREHFGIFKNNYEFSILYNTVLQFSLNLLLGE